MIDAPGADYSRKWLVMIAVSVGVLLATIDASIVNIAFPTLVDELETTFNSIQWVALGYLLTIATLTLGMGRLGDVIGKKGLYVAGYVGFTVASALCGLAPDVGWLIGFRVLQAVGAVLVLSLGSAILVEAFPPTERGKALGWIGTAVSLGIISGPVIGGLLISAFSWRAIFFVNVPVGLIGTFVALRHVPKTPPAAGQRFDFLGAALMSTSLLSLSLALTLGQVRGFASPPMLGLFFLAAATAAAFIRIEFRVESPMIELRLFKNPVLTVSVVSGFLTFVCMSATFFLLPFYLDGMLGLDLRTVGLLLGAAPLMVGLVSPLAGSLSDRIGVRPLTLAGLITMSGAYLGFLTIDLDLTVPHYLAIAIPLGIGVAVFQSPNNSAIMGSVPKEYMGVGGGLLTITRLLGQITGIAVLGSIWAANVARSVGGDLPDGGATAAPVISQMEGLHATFLIAAVIMASGVLVGAWGLRNERRPVRASA
ncbi:MAG: MFS transporter [Acidimicrobiia bacterium]|nr:MFS transporter [Acidimicrobiia bacterium]